jgi:N-acetylglucosaminyl-diphospho-decaprenol L-rhamnosyltransferase
MNKAMSSFEDDSNCRVIILNYRSAELTIDCLCSLAEEVASSGRISVTVIDNASGDGSVKTISETITRRGWAAWANIAALDRNGGYASGNNAGIRMALDSGARYFLILNPDTIVRPGALMALVNFMDMNPVVGIAGARLEDQDGEIHRSAHRFPTPAGELDRSLRFGPLSRLLVRHCVSPPMRDEAHPCDWVSGAALIIRRAVVEQVGLLDEGYFLYFEEVDYCKKVKQGGWQVWYVPQAEIVHREGSVTGITASRKRRPKYWYDSRRRYFLKHHGLIGLLTADVLWAIGRAGYCLRKQMGLTKHNDSDPKWFSWDLLLGDMKAICKIPQK